LALIRLLGLRTAAGIAPLIALVLAHGAAAGHIAIRRVDTSRYPLIRVTVVSPSASAKPPRLFENGRPVADVQAANLGREQSIVLALDHSQSMYNKPLADARNAAQRFVDAKPKSNQISVIAFASQALSLSRFSTSMTDVDDALGSISTDPVYGTALYDAVVLAAHELRSHGLPGRVIILVTDGQETTSEATLTQAITAARKAGAAVYAVAIPSGAFSPRPLQRLAADTGGRYYQAPSTKALRGIYKAIAAELRRVWRLEYPTAARPGDTLRVAAKVGKATAVKSERVPGQPTASSGSSTPTTLLVLLALVVGGSILLFTVLKIRSSDAFRRWERRLRTDRN
jgi:VWFA-related protein